MGLKVVEQRKDKYKWRCLLNMASNKYSKEQGRVLDFCLVLKLLGELGKCVKADLISLSL